MKPETRKRAWLFAAVLSLWLSSLFVYQTIVADPRYEPGGVWSVEFFVCAFALMLAVAAMILHARKSAIRLITSLVLLGVATFCLLNTRTAAFFMYKDSAPANVTVGLDGVGPVQIGFGDFNSDSEFFPSIKIDSQDAIAKIPNANQYGLVLDQDGNAPYDHFFDFHNETFNTVQKVLNAVNNIKDQNGNNEFAAACNPGDPLGDIANTPPTSLEDFIQEDLMQMANHKRTVLRHSYSIMYLPFHPEVAMRMTFDYHGSLDDFAQLDMVGKHYTDFTTPCTPLNP
jgi:hypothetical protein